MKFPRLSNILKARKTEFKAEQESAHEADLNSLKLHRHDDHHYGLHGRNEIFNRTWVLEGLRGKVIYTFRQEIEESGDVTIDQAVRLLSVSPLAPGQEKGTEGAQTFEAEQEFHPVLRTEHSMPVFRELAEIYMSGLPAL